MSRHRACGSAAVIALGVALLAAGCSSDDATSIPPTATTATTAAAATEPGAGPTTAELVAILPAAIDLGETWLEKPAAEVEPAGDRSSADRALEAQCPELAGLVGADAGADDRTVVRSYVDADGRELEIELDPDARARSDAELQEAVDATNACDQVVVDDPAGLPTTLRFQAAVDPDHGEQAVKLQAEVGLTLPSEEEPISLTLYGLVFRTGSVGVRLTATDGLDPESLEVSRSDLDLLTTLADRLEASADDLAG